jgi:hypothetical protein
VNSDRKIKEKECKREIFFRRDICQEQSCLAFSQQEPTDEVHWEPEHKLTLAPQKRVLLSRLDRWPPRSKLTAQRLITPLLSKEAKKKQQRSRLPYRKLWAYASVCDLFVRKQGKRVRGRCMLHNWQAVIHRINGGGCVFFCS